MPQIHKPRKGSMQYWPRKRASKRYARIRTWADSDEAKPLAFAGYKVGMTHVMGVDNRKDSATQGEEKPYPVTILECPPMKIATVRFYTKNNNNNLTVQKEILVSDDKQLARKLDLSNNTGSIDDENPEDYEDITVLVHTQPGKTAIESKKPAVFEVKLGGDVSSKFNFIKEKIGEDIKVSEIFEEGELTDSHGITKAKGIQGPVKRFGIGLKQHKAEKGRRRPGALGDWERRQHIMFRVPQAGNMGYHQRTQYNNQIFVIDDNPDDINVEGGFKRYGEVQNEYLLVKGSLQGPTKRLVTLTKPVRPGTKPPLPDITYTSTTSKQGL